MAEPFIEANPRIMMGKPVIAGTRITVETILERLAAGKSVAKILDAFPHLSEAAIRAAMEFAARPK